MTQLQNQTEILIKSLQKTTQMILNMYNLLKSTPKMIQINCLIDYAKNIEKMTEDFYHLIPKKCVPMYLHKKLQNQLKQKDNYIKKLQQSQKQLKIQARVLQQRLNKQLSNKQQEMIALSKMKQQYRPAHRKSLSLKKLSRGEIAEKSVQLYKIKSKLSFPSLGSEKLQKKYKHFVQSPGEGNQRLIYHLMSKQ